MPGSSKVIALRLVADAARNAMTSNVRGAIVGPFTGSSHVQAGKTYLYSILALGPRWAIPVMHRQFLPVLTPEDYSDGARRPVLVASEFGGSERSTQPFAIILESTFSRRRFPGRIEAPETARKAMLRQLSTLTGVSSNAGSKILSWSPLSTTNKPLVALHRFQSAHYHDRGQIQSRTDVIKAVDAAFVENVLHAPNQTIKGYKYVLIDVREPTELQTLGRIPTAINIPLGDLESAWNLDPQMFQKRFRQSKPKEDNILILFCQRGRRSLEACSLLQRKFGLHCVNYKGSFLDWSSRCGMHVESRREDLLDKDG